jgi:acetyl-CoA C-acetyltransferase/acetyl-CoA acyltransferase
MREAVVVATARTPLAKSFRGSLNMTRPDDMAAHCLRAVLERAPGVDPAEVEDVILGCGEPHHQQGFNVARIAAIRAGLPVTVPGVTVNRYCASGLQSVAMAAHEIVHEAAEVVLAGGVESITEIAQAPRDDKKAANPWIVQHKSAMYMVMGDTAEVVAKRYKASRELQDEYALSSQQRTARAQETGILREEIAPIRVTRAILDKKSFAVTGAEELLFDRDECNRPDTTLDGLRSLKPHFDQTSGQGTVTAGNASQLADGAAAILLMERSRAEKLGLKPLIAFRGYAVAACEPDEMGIGPVFAVPKLLARHGLTVNDIGLWELNEAFAVQVVYCRDRLGIDPAKLNVNGGSISLGHPYGMTGSRLVGALANEMRRRKARYGVVTMCIGGGQGAAGLFELCN